MCGVMLDVCGMTETTCYGYRYVDAAQLLLIAVVVCRLLLVDLCHHPCQAFASTAVSRHALDSQFSASHALISLAVGDPLVCPNVIHGLLVVD